MALPIPVKSFEKHLNCSICVEIFSDPRALPCMHTFCQKCLQSYINSLHSKRDMTLHGFKCPVCRKLVKVPVKGIAIDEWAGQFTPNYTVKGLIEEHVNQCRHKDFNNGGEDRYDQSNNMLVCDSHSEKMAEFKCEDHSPICLCCAVCAARKHKRCDTLLYLGAEETSSENEEAEDEKSAERHRTLSRLAHINVCEDQEERQAQNQSIIEDFDKSHITHVDSYETKEKHRSHRSPHPSLKRVVDNARSHAFETCEDLRKLSATIPSHDLLHRTDNVEVICCQASRNIVPTAPPSDSIHTSDDMNIVSFQSVRPANQNNSVESENLNLPLYNKTQGTREHDTHLGLRRLVHGTASHSFEENDDLRRLSARKNTNDNNPELVSNQEIMKGRRNVARSRPASAWCKEMSIITEIPEDDATLLNSSQCSYETSLVSLKSTLTHSVDILVKIDEDCKDCFVTGMCSMPDGRVVLADKNNYKVKVFDSNSSLISYVTLPAEPWDVDSVGECEVVASLPNAMCLFTLIVHDQITIGRRIDVGKKCYGVIFSCMEFITACVNDVRIFSYNGDLITRIVKDKKSLIPNLRPTSSNLKYICTDSLDSDKLYISDMNRGLLCVSRNGDVKSCISCDKGCPLGMASSCNRTLLVCQIPNYLTLYVIGNDGCRTKDVLSLDNVQTVDINKLDQKVWVSKSNSNSISVFVIKT